MDWPLAIDRNRDQLLRIIAALFAMAGLSEGARVALLPRHVYRAVLNVLRPAESAVRRLIIIVARGLVLKVRASSVAKKGARPFPHIEAASVPAFPLIDPRKRFAPEGFEWDKVKVIQRIRVLGGYEPLFLPMPPVPAAKDSTDLIGATGLCRRLQSLKLALQNLPQQARRLARLHSRQALARKIQKPFQPGLLPPARPGSPPGFRKRPVREIDHVLRECHALAMDIYAGDTS